ncbi:MAG: YbjN domain-containing protein [Gemmataceae bacterium]|nr:YbjN domain-containing protein [Gemmataceae bacterium]
MRWRRFPCSCVVACLTAACLVVPGARAQDDKVFKQLTAAETEAILQALKIDFKKTPAKKEGIVYYDFQRGGHKMRLYWYNGKDLMLDAVFPGMSLDRVNQWNVRAKFSRACLHRDAKGEFTALESNLDLAGGATEGAVRHFFKVFDDEVKLFAKVAGGGGDDALYTRVASDKLEAILKSLSIDYRKTQGKGAAAYEFESNNFKLRLVNFGGEDLMIDAQFKKLKLDDVNQYNLNRKFIRCVAYNVGGREYTSLESNLDCVGGVTDSIVRNFIRAFDIEVAEFAKYVQGK